MPDSFTPDQDAQLLDIGHQCSAPSCLLHDFLPFKCQHCNQPFCSDHYLPAAHKCDKYDETKHNRIAPSCPLCNTPVAIPPGQDPNIRMERHINTECSVMTGRTKTSSTPHCARPKCGKVLFAPIRCESCKQQFCPQHRFPKDHSCASATNATSTTSTPRSQASAAGSAALASFKRSLNHTTTPAARPAPAQTRPTANAPRAAPLAASSSAPAASSSRPNPFSKTDRRAKAERESRLKAMHEREKKGLLTEEEKAILAAERAEAASRKKDDCIIA